MGAMIYTSKEAAKRRDLTPIQPTSETDSSALEEKATQEVSIETQLVQEVAIVEPHMAEDRMDAAQPTEQSEEKKSISFLSSFAQWFDDTSKLLGLQGKGLRLTGTLFLAGWIGSGIYNVQPDEQGVVVRFGKWVETNNPGLHYHLPYPIETVIFPKVTQVNQLKLGDAVSFGTTTSKDNSHNRQMLTGDENIVEAECTVFWRIKNAELFLFKINNPEFAIKVTAESALREVISRTPIQSAMSDKRQQIADQTKELLQSLLDKEKSGILITQVQLQKVDPPAAVIDAFNDVQRARADQERERNEAEAYANDIIPRARGEMARITQDAEAYKNQVINLAEGDAKGFLSIYASYAKAKDVTAWRLYLEGIDEVLKKSAKVIIDTSGRGVSGIVPYMPLSEKEKPTAKDKPLSKEVAK